MGDGGITLITAGNVSNAVNFSITGYPEANQAPGLYEGTFDVTVAYN